MWKKRIQTAGWYTLALLVLALLVTAMQQKDHAVCKEIKVEIEGAQDHVFVDEKDVLRILKQQGATVGSTLASVPLRRLETLLEKDPWIRQADLFFDNNQVLQVKIEESEPLARIFTLQGNSFYIDSSGQRLPLSDKLSARVPVITSFPSDKNRLSAPDSAVLQDVKQIAQYIQKDSFWMEQVAQIDITPQRTYELIPVLGNQVVMLGDATDLDKKFDRLFSFYKQVWAKAGFEKYESIDVRYKGQVVAIRKGTGKQWADSSKAMQVLNNSIARMNAAMKDSTGATPVMLSPAAAGKDSATAAATKPPVKRATAKQAAARNTQAARTPARTVLHKGQPRAVMPKKVKR